MGPIRPVRARASETTNTWTWARSAADAACYVAKESGRSRMHEYQPDDTAMAERYRGLRVTPAPEGSGRLAEIAIPRLCCAPSGLQPLCP